jgi:hypothetical protein
MTWTIIVLLPKGKGNYHGIGLLNPICNAIGKEMVARFSVVQLKNYLHCGLPKWGMGKAIVEVKLQQQLVWVDQDPLCQTYLDLRKAYDALYWGHCLKILAGYGVGPKLLRLQKQFWKNPKMCVMLGAIMGSPLEPIEALCRGGLSPASCSMFVSTVSSRSGSGKCWETTLLVMV